MNRTLARTWPLFLALIGVAGLVYAGWKMTSDSEPVDDYNARDYDDVEPEIDPSPGEQWDTVSTIEVDDVEEFPGAVRAEGSLELRAPIGMRAPVLTIHKEVGEYVEKGDPVITFFIEKYEEARDKARADGDEAKAKEYEEYIAAEVLRAPADGQVMDIHTSEGEISYDVGKPMMTLTDRSGWSFLVSVPGHLVTDRVPLGAKVEVEFEEIGVVKGTVTAHDNDPRQGPSAPSEGDRVLLIIGLEAAEGIQPFLSGVVRLPVGKKEVMLVPAAAVEWRGPVAVVRVWDQDMNGISEQTIQPQGEERDGKLVVLYGVAPGQPIIVRDPVE